MPPKVFIHNCNKAIAPNMPPPSTGSLSPNVNPNGSTKLQLYYIDNNPRAAVDNDLVVSAKIKREELLDGPQSSNFEPIGAITRMKTVKTEPDVMKSKMEDVKIEESIPKQRHSTLKRDHDVLTAQERSFSIAKYKEEVMKFS